MSRNPHRISVIDSHTGGEPTRVVMGGAPDLGGGTMEQRRLRFAENADFLRPALLGEPRGFEAMVGALLCDSEFQECACGVIFFNNSGLLNSCLHGTIGLVKTLEFTGRITFGEHRIETPVGIVRATLNPDGSVTVANVPSYRYREAVAVEVPGWGEVRGDIAWGGNWFYLVEGCGPELTFGNISGLSDFTLALMHALEVAGITGEDGARIDHVEVFGPPPDQDSDSRNFVMCPGGQYDRSPCGTGTSAKLACLHASGKLEAGATWRQSSILGTVFEGRVEPLEDGRVIPFVTGRAWVNGECEIVIDPDDPFGLGIAQE
ncbi:MAG: proline racemase family protein [Verrucomicrobiales bacterium]